MTTGHDLADPEEGLRNVTALTDLSQEEAIGVVAASVRRLFTVVSEQQARNLAALVLADLRAQGVRLVQDDGSP